MACHVGGDEQPTFAAEKPAKLVAASSLDLAAMSPTASSWAAGDREVVCILVPIPFNESLMGSMRGAAV